jgi:hypothetical protein
VEFRRSEELFEPIVLPQKCHEDEVDVEVRVLVKAMRFEEFREIAASILTQSGREHWCRKRELCEGIKDCIHRRFPNVVE